MGCIGPKWIDLLKANKPNDASRDLGKKSDFAGASGAAQARGVRERLRQKKRSAWRSPPSPTPPAPPVASGRPALFCPSTYPPYSSLSIASSLRDSATPSDLSPRPAPRLTLRAPERGGLSDVTRGRIRRCMRSEDAAAHPGVDESRGHTVAQRARGPTRYALGGVWSAYACKLEGSRSFIRLARVGIAASGIGVPRSRPPPASSAAPAPPGSSPCSLARSTSSRGWARALRRTSTRHPSPRWMYRAARVPQQRRDSGAPPRFANRLLLSADSGVSDVWFRFRV